MRSMQWFEPDCAQDLNVEVECAKVASWSRCFALSLSGACNKKLTIPARNILASFWFKTLVSSIDGCFNGSLMRWLVFIKILISFIFVFLKLRPKFFDFY